MWFKVNNVQLQWNYSLHFPINSKICTMCLQFKWFHVDPHTDFHIFRLHFLPCCVFFFFLLNLSLLFTLTLPLALSLSLHFGCTLLVPTRKQKKKQILWHIHIDCLNTFIICTYCRFDRLSPTLWATHLCDWYRKKSPQFVKY